MKSVSLNIFEYTNYRDFLKDYYARAKEAKNNFSHRWFARRAGFSSPSFLNMVITGQRSLSRESISKVSTTIGLNKREQQYFETLVAFNQAKEPESKRYYLELLFGIRKDKTGSVLKDEQIECLSNWYYPVIREMVALPEFKEDPAWIKKQLNDKISVKEAREAIELLLRINLLIRDENGRLKHNDANFYTEEELKHTAAYQFHKQMLALANNMIETTPQNRREFAGVTMAVSEKQFNDIKKMVQDFEHSILRYLTNNSDTPSTVFQLNMQLFPVMVEGSGGKNE